MVHLKFSFQRMLHLHSAFNCNGLCDNAENFINVTTKSTSNVTLKHSFDYCTLFQGICLIHCINAYKSIRIESPICDFHICNRMSIAVAAFTMWHVTTACMHAASLDNFYPFNINGAPLSAAMGHARAFACRWHQTRNNDQRREKSHLFHSLCNAKASGKSAFSISGLKKRS